MLGRYFLTVDWCSKGRRGVFCSNDGKAYPKDGEEHTREEMEEILGAFYVVLSPKSEFMTKEELATYNKFVPLSEYTDMYGIALKAEV